MKKVFLFLCVLAFSLNGNCYAQDINKIATIAWKYEITGSRDVYQPWTAVAVGEDNIVFTDRYTRSIYRFSKKNNTFTQIGRNGSGPGEYKLPALLYYNNNIIYFADQARNEIQGIDLNGKYIRKIDLKLRLGLYSPFAVSGDKAFIANTAQQTFWVKESNGNESLPQQECFKNFPVTVMGGSIITHNNRVFYINPFEFALFSRWENDKEWKRTELTGIDNAMSWKSYYNSKINGTEYETIDKYKWHVRPFRLIKMIKDKKLYLVITYTDNKNKTSGFAVFSEAGKLLLNTETGNLVLFDASGGTFKFYRQDDEGMKGFYYYALKKEFAEKIR